MALIIVDHARQRMEERGVSDEDLAIVLATESRRQEEAGRMSKEVVLAFGGTWQGRRYPQKLVRVIYVEEAENTVVITVFAFYGSWE